MKKYIYFGLGYITAFVTIFLASCTYSQLEASGGELGSSPYTPLYVKVVE